VTNNFVSLFAPQVSLIKKKLQLQKICKKNIFFWWKNLVHFIHTIQSPMTWC